jgi:hypothetical protein
MEYMYLGSEILTMQPKEGTSLEVTGTKVVVEGKASVL